MMKHFAKRGIVRLWMVVLLAGLSMVTVSAVASAVKIGDNYGGGIVFFVDVTGQHGLVAATSDAGEKTNWYDAKIQANHFRNGYGDWCLPNSQQLNQLYINRSAVGGFSYYGCWSSTEGSAEGAWGQGFGSGYQDGSGKSVGWCVRAVRAF